ncbi:MAG: Cof-type HAD-IIB family hydrolase [Clostridia bacterium]|nr:Cof-type HAD-IIB family hydrolase [Clostridia bacterium]
MSIKLIASDLDGTIIDENNFISPNNITAINDINNQNINFAICTGKSYSISKSLCSKFDAQYGIFGNGSHIVDLKTGKSIYKNVLSIEQIENCINIAKKYNLHIHAYSDKEIITPKLKYMDLRNYKLNFFSNSKFLITDNILECIKQNNLSIFQIVISSDFSLDNIKDKLLHNNNLSITIISKFGKYKDMIIDKEYEYLSISSKNTDKNQALDFLKNYLGLKNDEVMAVGDNLNDFSMIKHSGIGVAVANAYDEIKNVATYTTKNNVSQGAFAEAVYKFIDFNDNNIKFNL